MLRSTRPARTEAHVVGSRFGQRHKLFNAAYRHRRVHDQHIGQRCQQRHRCEILKRVVGQLAVQAAADGMRRNRAAQYRITVRRCLGHQLRTDGPGGAGTIIDDDLLAPGIAEALTDNARQNIRHAPRRKGHDIADGFGGIGRLRCLGTGPADDGQTNHRQRGQRYRAGGRVEKNSRVLNESTIKYQHAEAPCG